jgi:formate hydrogenlyase transcriptional activator
VINLEGRFNHVVGRSPELRRVLKLIAMAAPTAVTVLIEGETGTGKGLLARAIHDLSPRRGRPFVKLNCAAIPASLVESELFGHERGAFTGAIARKIGRIEMAHEGTLFLDEVGDLPLELQPKLLDAVEAREIERVGGTRPIPVNFRLVAATNRDLATMVEEKRFRSELYYRLMVFPVLIPPLRERATDIPELVRHFVAGHSQRMGKVIETIAEEDMHALARWPWPGNVRELENFIARAIVLTRGPVLQLPLHQKEIDRKGVSPSAPVEQENVAPNVTTLSDLERTAILSAIHAVSGDKLEAARLLGIGKTTLYRKLKEYGIADPPQNE